MVEKGVGSHCWNNSAARASGSEELLAAAQTCFDLAERTCGLFSACVDEFPEPGIGLKEDGFPILSGYAH